jgi:hypothetical protein
MSVKSVLQDWVMELPLREQGTLLTAVRGCDLAPKTDDALSSPERHLVAFVRWCFLNPHDPREVDKAAGCWFRSTPPDDFRPSSVMHYPLHWYSHVMHALQVIRCRHPRLSVQVAAEDLYLGMVRALHLNAEDPEQMIARLNEDRIALGNIVS